MQEHEKRVVNEATELHEKMIKLAAFMEGEHYQKLPIEDRYFLRCQYAAMKTYFECLQARIAMFE